MTDGPSEPPGGADRDAARVRVFPPAIPLLTVLAGVALDRVVPIAAMPGGTARQILGGAVILASVYLLGFRAVRALRRTGQTENPYKPTTEIVEVGPFRITRNPMYLQMVLVCFGLAMLLGNFWIALLTPVCALLLQLLVIRQEEAYLDRKFGEVYRDYKRRVRRWL